jgi:ketosteroid isomerase-like protein
VGQQAIRAASQKYFDQYTDEGRSILEDVRVSGDLAIARGTFKGTSTPKTGGSPAQLQDKFLTAFQRQADGSWRAFWDIYNSDLPMPGTTADGAEEQAVIKVEQDWGAALARRDVATIERILGKEWTENVGGQITTRAQAIAGQKSGAIRFESITVHDLSVHVFGDAAVATMLVVIKGTQNGSDRSGSERSTDFFVKRDGRWQAVSTQNTAIK